MQNGEGKSHEMGQGGDIELFLVRKLWRTCGGFRELRSKGSNEEETQEHV